MVDLLQRQCCHLKNNILDLKMMLPPSRQYLTLKIIVSERLRQPLPLKHEALAQR
jgi:hypothetical protein